MAEGVGLGYKHGEGVEASYVVNPCLGVGDEEGWVGDIVGSYRRGRRGRRVVP